MTADESSLAIAAISFSKVFRNVALKAESPNSDISRSVKTADNITTPIFAAVGEPVKAEGNRVVGLLVAEPSDVVG